MMEDIKRDIITEILDKYYKKYENWKEIDK